MSVYREGYHILKQIQINQAQQVFNDAADAGAPVQKGDALWNGIKQLKEWYGVTLSEKQPTNDSKCFEFQLMDEWAVSDKRKTEQEALEQYRLTYTKLESYQKKPYLNPAFKGKHGFVYVEKI